MLTAIPLVLLAALTLGAEPPTTLIRRGADPARGLLVNRTPGARPFDPLDPSRATVVFVHGWNPTPGLVHFEMAARLAEALARRGTVCNVAEWDWNAATSDSLRPSVNCRNSVAQGQLLADRLARSGVDPARLHLIGHSAGAIVAAAAGHRFAHTWGRPVAQLTLLEPATYYHELVFRELHAGTCAPIVENYYTDSPSAFGQEVHLPGVRDHHVDGRSGLLGVINPTRSDHLHLFHWYLTTVTDRSIPTGFNTNRTVP